MPKHFLWWGKVDGSTKEHHYDVHLSKPGFGFFRPRDKQSLSCKLKQNLLKTSLACFQLGRSGKGVCTFHHWSIRFLVGCETCPGLDHVFIRLGPAPPTPLSLPSRPAHTCVGTLPSWGPM